jgi:peptidoglycan/xylan/chitin deacetylase (PgdA/CDA1 family)
MNPLKRTLATGFELTGLNAALLALQRAIWHPHIRCVNYHDVPRVGATAFEDQLRFYAKHFAPVGRDDLLALHEGRWDQDRPGLLLSFDDGLRSHVEIAAPLLEKYGMTGWFLVPAAVVRGAPGSPEWKHTVVEDTLDYQGLRQLDRNHVIGCHTFSHRRLESSLTEEELAWEIPAAKRQLVEWLEHPVDVFAWVGGEEWTYSAAAAEAIRQAGFRISFMTNNALIHPGDDLLQVQRTNIETHFPPAVARFGLSGFFDVTYGPKRRRVNRLTAAG